MQTIIMTIKPYHLRNIRMGIKKGELRKSFPKIELPFRVLLCESGSGGQIKAEFTCRDILAIDTQCSLLEGTGNRRLPRWKNWLRVGRLRCSRLLLHKRIQNSQHFRIWGPAFSANVAACDDAAG